MSIEIDDVISDYLWETVNDLYTMNMFQRAVQYYNNGGSMASAEATFILSGPPVLNPRTKLKKPFENYLYPIGGLQSYSLQQGLSIMPFPELGSILKRHAMGSGNYGASLSRPDVKHSSMKYSLYAWLPKFLKDHNADYATNEEILMGYFPAAQGKQNPNVNMSNEIFNKQWVGLDSDIFGVPFGLLCITGTSNGKVIHIEYLEGCYINSNGKSVSAGSPMIMPSMSLTVTRPVPYIDMNTGLNLLSTNAQLKLNSLLREKPYVIASK